MGWLKGYLLSWPEPGGRPVTQDMITSCGAVSHMRHIGSGWEHAILKSPAPLLDEVDRQAEAQYELVIRRTTNNRFLMMSTDRRVISYFVDSVLSKRVDPPVRRTRILITDFLTAAAGGSIDYFVTRAFTKVYGQMQHITNMSFTGENVVSSDVFRSLFFKKIIECVSCGLGDIAEEIMIMGVGGSVSFEGYSHGGRLDFDKAAKLERLLDFLDKNNLIVG